MSNKELSIKQKFFAYILHLWDKEKFEDIVQRAVFTFCQTLAASILATGSAGVIGVTSVAWGTAISIALLATIISVLQNVARQLQEPEEE